MSSIKTRIGSVEKRLNVRRDTRTLEEIKAELKNKLQEVRRVSTREEWDEFNEKLVREGRITQPMPWPEPENPA
jgi:hypothetical protein